MQKVIAARPLCGLVWVALVLSGFVSPAAGKHLRDTLPPQEGAEYRSVEQALGYRECAGNYFLLTVPYSRKTVEEIIGRIGRPGLSPRALYLYFHVLTRIVQQSDGWEAPTVDVRELVRPAVARLAEELAKQPAAERSWEQSAAMAAERCLWNIDQALAWAERAKAEKDHDEPAAKTAEARLRALEGTARTRYTRPHTEDYLGDLVVWAMRGDLKSATHEIDDLAKLTTRDERQLFSSARAELRVREQLAACATDDARSQVLEEAVSDPKLPLPARGWATRALGKIPAERAATFLVGIYLAARDRPGEYELGLAAQEVLVRLGRIPANTSRYRPPP